MCAPQSELGLLIIVDLAGFGVDSNGGAVLGWGHSSGLMGQNGGFILMLAEPVVKSVDGGDGGCVSVMCFAHGFKIKMMWIRQLNLFISH